MKVVNLPCPRCGAQLKVDIEAREAHCPYCKADFPIEQDLTKTAKDFEEAGYKFEKGRQRAQSEGVDTPAQPTPHLPKQAIFAIVAIAIVIIAGIVIFSLSQPSNNPQPSNTPQTTNASQTSNTAKEPNERVVYLSKAIAVVPEDVYNVWGKNVNKDEVLSTVPKAVHFKNDDPTTADVEFSTHTETGKVTEIYKDKINIDLETSGTKLQGEMKGTGRYVATYSEANAFELTFIESENEIENPEVFVQKENNN